MNIDLGHNQGNRVITKVTEFMYILVEKQTYANLCINIYLVLTLASIVIL